MSGDDEGGVGRAAGPDGRPFDELDVLVVYVAGFVLKRTGTNSDCAAGESHNLVLDTWHYIIRTRDRRRSMRRICVARLT